ncbi:MAG: hypothetical protein RMJ36_01015 [Candidatus Calescibacterium sp.]|nr:hypothetical protein [Candidatus Calescibacterium sp.]MDW8132221.1 hypothetical protein [Candidatus Calescibacterium sp.]
MVIVVLLGNAIITVFGERFCNLLKDALRNDWLILDYLCEGFLG